jgi:hypothetical protein
VGAEPSPWVTVVTPDVVDEEKVTDPVPRAIPNWASEGRTTPCAEVTHGCLSQSNVTRTTSPAEPVKAGEQLAVRQFTGSRDGMTTLHLPPEGTENRVPA